MKKILVLMAIFLVSSFNLQAQTITEREPTVMGDDATIIKWMKDHDKDLKKIAGNFNWVVTYYKKGSPSGSGKSVAFYDYKDLPKGRIGTVLEFTDKTSGDTILVVFTNEATGDNAVFYNDNDKKQLDKSFATGLKKYGMSGDTVNLIRQVIVGL